MILKPLNKQTWRDYVAQEEHNTSCFIGYTEAVESITDEIQKILNFCNNFEELKREIQAFNSERQDFLNDVENNWSPPTFYPV